MDEKQTRIMVVGIVIVFVAIVIWWMFIVKGPRSGVADLPKRPNPASQRPGAPQQPMNQRNGPSLD